MPCCVYTLTSSEQPKERHVWENRTITGLLTVMWSVYRQVNDSPANIFFFFFFYMMTEWKKILHSKKKNGIWCAKAFRVSFGQFHWVNWSLSNQAIDWFVNGQWLALYQFWYLINGVIFGVKWLPREDLPPLSSMTAVVNPFGMCPLQAAHCLLVTPSVTSVHLVSSE